MFDGILKTHGKLLGGIAAFLFLIVMLVGEPDSPGVLSDVQAQAEAAAAKGQPPLPIRGGADPPPSTGAGLAGRSDAIGQNRVILSDTGSPSASTHSSIPAAPSGDRISDAAAGPRTPPAGPPPSAVGRPAL